MYVLGLCWAMLLGIAVVSLWLKESFPHWCWCNQRWEFGFLLPRDYLNCSRREVSNCRISFVCSWDPSRIFSLRTGSPPHFNPKSGHKASPVLHAVTWHVPAVWGRLWALYPTPQLESTFLTTSFPSAPMRVLLEVSLSMFTQGIIKKRLELYCSVANSPFPTECRCGWCSSQLWHSALLQPLDFCDSPENRTCLHLPICSLRRAGN